MDSVQMSVEIFVVNSAEVDTATQAALAVTSLGSLMTDLKRNFMLKNVQSHVHVSVPNLGDSFMLVLAADDASSAEIATALTATSQNIEDSVDYNNGQVFVRRVWARASMNLNGIIAVGSI